MLKNLRSKVLGVQPVVTYRNEPVHAPANFPWETLSNQPDIRWEQAPQPVAASTFHSYGRDPEHAPTPIKLFQTLAIADWLSVMAWPFSIRSEPNAIVVGMPIGRFNPIRERSTITMPPQTTLSDLTTVDAVSIGSASLAKIS